MRDERHGKPVTGVENGPPSAPYWRRFAATFLSCLFGGLGSIYLFLLLIDPYDTGRFATPLKPGVFDGRQHIAAASRGRDPQFNSAVFGNSRAQLLDPVRLSLSTGLDFVQLTTPGSGPKEQLTLMRYFLRHHADVEAMVLSVDERWCGHDPSLPVLFPFPFWLYRGDLEYLTHLLSTRSIAAAQNRIKLAMGRVERTDPRGYRDYETGRIHNFHPGPGTAITAAAAPPADTYFPALDDLDALLAEVPARVRFVIVMPPVYATMLPHPGSQSEADLAACKAALAGRLATRPGGGFLDFLVDGPISRDPENFMDQEHYRLNVAHMIEARLAAALDVRNEPGVR